MRSGNLVIWNFCTASVCVLEITPMTALPLYKLEAERIRGFKRLLLVKRSIFALSGCSAMNLSKLAIETFLV